MSELKLDVFVVVEPHMGYNDEIYNHEGSEDTTKAYANEELAKQSADEYNLALIKEHDSMSAYCYEMSDISNMSTDKMKLKLEKLGLSHLLGDDGGAKEREVTLEDLPAIYKVFAGFPWAEAKKIPLLGTAHDLAASIEAHG